MVSNNINLLRSILITLNIITQIESLVEMPVVEDNYIDYAEQVIRDTVNNLFVIFKIDKVQHGPRLKQFSSIHNFFASLTLQDCDNLKEIARLTRVNDVDNNTVDFITQINEVLNEGDINIEANDNSVVYVGTYIQKFIKTLQYLKNKYVSDGSVVINSDILKYLHKKGSPTSKIRIRHKTPENNNNILSDNEFWRPKNRRIFDGIRTGIKHFPFMASIHFFNQFQCAGSIIKSDLVITSSSCLQLAWNNRFFRENPAFLSVRVGSDKYEVGGDTITVIEINFHPGYNSVNLHNNIAILRLSRKISFGRKIKRVKRVNFDRNPSMLSTNVRKITVVGWGAKSPTNIISDVFTNLLSYAQLDYYPLIECQEHYSKEFVTEKHFCAGFFSKGGGACNRDAGGPGIVDGVLTGVISFGSPICGDINSPTVFTKLGHYADWIETIMEKPKVRHGKETSTLAPRSTYLVNFNPKPYTKGLFKVFPIANENYYSRTQQKQSHDTAFKDFLKTIFNSQELKEFENNNDDNNTFVDYESYKQTVPEMSIKNVENPVEVNTEMINTRETTKSIDSINTLTQSSLSINTLTEIEEILESENATRSVTVMESFSLEKDDLVDDSLDVGVMKLIDDLDVEDVLQTESKLLKKDILNSKDKNGSLEQSTSSASGENTDDIDSAQQKLLNYLVSSIENQDDKDEGLNIPVESFPFHDLTLRDKNKTSNKTVNEVSLAEMIASAIDEEQKKLKNLQYSV